MKRSSRRRAIAIIGTAAAAMMLASCGSNSSTSSSTSRVAGGVVTFAEQPSSSPNYIFPITPPADESVDNLSQFQPLMYRPLYWFGVGEKAELNESLSLADPPVYSNGDKTVTIHLKSYKWSDGEPVTSRDVIFFMNLLEANKLASAEYVPGQFPDNVVSYTAPNASTVVFQLNRSYSTTWFTDNELSQITPLPMAWDRTSLSQPAPSPTAPNLPDTTNAGAKAVYNFLNSQAEILSTYATSPIWSVVDGPWKLKSFTTEGRAVFVPNRAYSGPVKPSLSEFIELPFTSAASEFNVLRAGNNAITYGYLPRSDLPQVSSVESSGYSVRPWIAFGFNYFGINFNNPTYGPVFEQLYFRQALQHLVDQKSWITTFLKGYGTPSYSPVPLAPANTFADTYTKSNPYPYSISSAKALLSSHGWKLVNGVMTCENAGIGVSDCGASIPKGLKLNLNLVYPSGETAMNEEVVAYASAAQQVGIAIHLAELPFDSVLSDLVPCQSSQAACNWQIGTWGTDGGWTYATDPDPTAGTLFSAGSEENTGSYVSATANQLIDAAHTSANSQSALDSLQNFLAKQLPGIYMPMSNYSVAVISSKLHGVTQNPYLTITPENWYLTK